MATTAKVRIYDRQPSGDGQTTLHFTADYADGANKEWAKYTPGLSLTMTVKDEVLSGFEQGSYTLTFEPVED